MTFASGAALPRALVAATPTATMQTPAAIAALMRTNRGVTVSVSARHAARMTSASRKASGASAGST
ncbi:hypothetical protein D3C85_1332740 [compost metagenome]